MDRLAAVLTAPLLPLWAVAGRIHPRWRIHWRGRWGLEVPPVQPGAIWVHAASMGEVGAAWALVERLPGPVLLTADTDTGVARAERLLAEHPALRPRVAVGPKPVDHLLTLAPLWAEARPRLIVFVEGTFWPALAWRAHRAGVPVVRVSAKVGPRTRRLGPLLRAWWWPVDAVWARDPGSAAVLERVHRGPVRVGADLKSTAPRRARINPLTWPGPFAVGASTRDGDEARLLAALDQVYAGSAGPRCLLAPRHPERFEVVARLLEAQGRRWVRRSALPDGRVPAEVDVVLLDTLGELAAALGGARFVFVGGTFDPAIGGHSPWEPAAAGAPVVAGPHVHAQGDAFARVGASFGADLVAAIRAATAGSARLGPAHLGPAHLGPVHSGPVDPGAADPGLAQTGLTDPGLDRGRTHRGLASADPAHTHAAPSPAGSSPAGSSPAGPDSAEPVAAHPDPTGPDPTGPDHTAPDRTGPDPTGPDPTGPDRTAPDPTGPDPTGPDPTGPDPTGPDPTGPDATGPDPTAPDPTAPDPADRLTADLLALAGDPAPEAAPRPWALPIAALYGAAASARDLAFDLGWRPIVQVGVPVISVGSTNARSPGRTSTVRALAGALAARGHVVGVALRGYRRAARTREVRVSWEDPGADALGDEGALLAVAGAKIAAGPDRVEAARRLVAAGCTVVVLDDGLQHRRLHRDLDLAVIDARYPTARGLLPAGERRERAVVPARAHLVLVHHGGGRFTFPGEPVRRGFAEWVRGDGGAGPPVGPVAALAGIGRPADLLASLDLPVARFLALPDHAPVDEALADHIEAWAAGLPIVCTHKDAVRLPPRLRARAAWREVDLVLPDALLARLPPAPAGLVRPSTGPSGGLHRGRGEPSDEQP